MTLLLGFGGAVPAESAIVCRYGPGQKDSYTLIEQSDTDGVLEYEVGLIEMEGIGRVVGGYAVLRCCTAAEG